MKISATPSGSRGRRVAVPTLLVLVASIEPCRAYIDPGTGTMLLQMAAAGLAGALFFFRQVRMQIASWFRRVILRQKEEAGSSPGSDRPSSKDTEV